MEIILAKSAGFCFGVKRATQMAFDASSQHEQIHSLGPLIHSPQVVEQLEQQGVRVCKQVAEIPGGAVVVRSHGITAEEMQEIEDKHLQVIDATCPFVKKAQDYAEKLSADGYLVVLVGEADHPEVQGIFSYAKGEAVVVTCADDVKTLPENRKIGIVAQTTQPFENLKEIVDACLIKAKELRVYNTICDATTLRQREARQIAAEVDLMLVVGGFNSANTSRLARLCKEQQPCTHHIETAAQLEQSWFVNKEKVGLTAGASTPGWIIDEVVQRLKKIAAAG
ncbi:4-hydroxy-3-methylbut-2-enyl diphosphate reductase [Malonomonas rubra DSM 5091]|uniref:4-hydroxy-3-methylbut-2-enyl diphosphate reductase n=1 Tax=Malonomonas rubra DSM 5091 TaxID=1122189 RepID=A0A1M6CC90_MALRU|nr:4-hydroxy-3-methylbut-2-enyl diphosphate reductase [Malonomonas rubra]SHI58404.1 4-hydroxy-3-methylbut-2-enyl diphosphate reductase [Malonomonas rubra DSM 5091]